MGGRDLARLLRCRPRRNLSRSPRRTRRTPRRRLRCSARTGEERSDEHARGRPITDEDGDSGSVRPGGRPTATRPTRDDADGADRAHAPIDGVHEPGPITARERWLVQTLLTVVLVGTNLVGALITVAMCAWVIPIPSGVEFRLTANAIAVPIYVAVAIAIGTLWGTRWLVGNLRWALESRPPTEEEACTAVRLPLQLVKVHAVLWAGGAVVLTLINGLLEPQTIPTVAFSTVLVGLVVCAIAYLASERILRPVAARALGYITPGRVVIPGVGDRGLMAWGLGSAIPVVGLMLVAVFALARQRRVPDPARGGHPRHRHGGAAGRVAAQPHRGAGGARSCS